MNRLGEIGIALAGAQRIVILSHVNPDPDTVGSAIGLSEILRGLGKQTTVLVPSPVTGSIPDIAGWQTVTNDETAARNAVERADFVISVDNTKLDRFGNWSWVLPRAKQLGITTANIDHHLDNAKFADLNYVAADAASNTMLIYKLAKEMRWSINPTAANALFAGLRSDTGGFKYPAGNYAATFRVAAALAKLGADAAVIGDEQDQLSSGQLRLLAYATMARVDSGALSYVCITQDMLRRAGINAVDAYAVVGQLSRRRETKLLAVLMEYGPDNIRLSVRSRAPYDARAVACKFGGGGHTLAAGAYLKLPMAGARQKVVAAARAAVREVEGRESLGVA